MTEIDKSVQKEFAEAYEKLREIEFEIWQAQKKGAWRKLLELQKELAPLEARYNAALRKLAESYNSTLHQDPPK